MKTSQKALLSALAVLTLGASASASAHDDRHWKHKHHHRHWEARAYDRYAHEHYYAPAYVVRERVLIERPVYVAPPPVYYYPPVRRPALVVGVEVPPIVIPLR